mmetsp:Transcript_39531/g.55707  ORF Transcript_39531/g.55707 Transcript_39531/m.55707 type:complete len:80 (+) Transcript_39531:948-1187(+)
MFLMLSNAVSASLATGLPLASSSLSPGSEWSNCYNKKRKVIEKVRAMMQQLIGGIFTKTYITNLHSKVSISSSILIATE